MFFVYILKSQKNGGYYIGQTNNINERLTSHNRGKDHSSKIGMPWKLIYTETYNTRKEAMARERFIKNKKSRKFIEDLITAG